ncbi:hypothetical protein CLV59_1011012 [Chitinophaga dinghuensis]|uniref:Uncharacterized protein n=1 Tax=Chitinophaga dinghuensis TaxID=1539050 RepID=A0A327WKC6_9BACT|nr:hypothetical protein CLV59_1011012 [Chitinophaga dinghuensis]
MCFSLWGRNELIGIAGVEMIVNAYYDTQLPTHCLA